MHLSQGDAFVRRSVPRLLFDGIEPADAFDGFPGDGGAGALEDIQEIAADMHHASLLAGQTLAEQPDEAGEPVGMHDALVAREMRGGMFALAIHAELVPGTGRSLSTPRPFIADIAPHPRGLDFAGLAPDLHLDRGIVGEESGSCLHLLANVIGQGARTSVERPTQSVSVDRCRSTFSRA